MIKDIF